MSQLTTDELHSDESTMHRHITLEPGALNNIPVVAFIQVLRAFGLRIGSDLVIRGGGELDEAAIAAMINAQGEQ